MACFNGHPEVVCALLSAGAKVNLLLAELGESPLHVACRYGHTEVVCTLLSAGAKANMQANKPIGFTPLHSACEFSHIGVVRALLYAGARADLRDINGMTPLDILPRALHADVVCLVQQAKEERGSTRADESRVGAPSSAPAAVLPSPHCQAGSQL